MRAAIRACASGPRGRPAARSTSSLINENASRQARIFVDAPGSEADASVELLQAPALAATSGVTLGGCRIRRADDDRVPGGDPAVDAGRPEPWRLRRRGPAGERRRVDDPAAGRVIPASRCAPLPASRKKEVRSGLNLAARVADQRSVAVEFPVESARHRSPRLTTAAFAPARDRRARPRGRLSHRVRAARRRRSGPANRRPRRSG